MAIRKEFILFCIYFLLIINIFLGIKIYSIEWAFLLFIISGIVFYISRIDSKFLILPAILLLGYAAFLWISNEQALAEIAAIYAYYFLVVGVILFAIEHIKKRENCLSFTETIKKMMNPKKLLTFSIIFALLTIMAYLTDNFVIIFGTWKIAFLYAFAFFQIMYGVTFMIE